MLFMGVIIPVLLRDIPLYQHADQLDTLEYAGKGQAIRGVGENAAIRR